MKSSECKLEILITSEEKELLESISRKNNIKSDQFAKMIIFETGIIDCESNNGLQH